MTPVSLTTEQMAEQRKRHREKLLIGLTLGLMVGLTTLEIFLVRRGGHPITGSLLAFSLLNLNAILFLLLTFLIFRHLTKLFLERRRKVFGSRLRTRLALTFLALALLPTLFMFFLAWQLISSRMDYQWTAQVEETLEQTLALGQTFSQGLEEKLRACGRLFQEELAGSGKLVPEQREALQAYLSEQLTAYKLTGLEVLTAAGEVVAAAYQGQPDEFPSASLPAGESSLPGPELVRRQVVKGGLLLSLLLHLTKNPASPPEVLVVRQIIPLPPLAQLTEMQRQAQSLRQAQMLIKPVRVSHYLTLVVVTLLTLMSAFWLAFYMAREITTPIRQLAEGALKVAEGDYNIQIDQEGKDEIGFLVQSFNKMTVDLQQSRAQLATTYEQLRDSHMRLKASKRHMEILLKNVAAGVIGIDAAGRIAAINDSAAQILRVRREEVLGQPSQVLLPPNDYERLAEMIAAAQGSQGTVEKPFHLSFPEQTRYLLLKCTTLKDDLGHDLGVVMVFEDLTDLERAQRQAAWREVARRIAHEVKNPLTPIKLAAQRLRRRYLGSFQDDGQIFDECTQIIIDQAEAIKDLVNEFSHFARLPSLSLTSQDLNALVQETLLLFQSVNPRITLEFQPDHQLPPILLDREQVKRVLLNLVDNALASIHEAGTITLAVHWDPAAELVRLVVADTGIGIPDREKARIFEPYFSTKRGGTGLGLAIVHSIVTEHQGNIRVEDNLPQGSKFIIELPFQRG